MRSIPRCQGYKGNASCQVLWVFIYRMACQIDVCRIANMLQSAADPRVGAGRVARLARPATAAEIAARLEPVLGCGRIQRSRTASSPPRMHERFAVCAGSGASLLEAAAAQGATLFVTGELSHHDVLRAHALGLEVLLAGHTNTERGYLPRLASALAAAAGIECFVSARDCDPLAPG